MRAGLQYQIDIRMPEMPLHTGSLRSDLRRQGVDRVRRSQQGREIGLVQGAPADGKHHAAGRHILAHARTIRALQFMQGILGRRRHPMLRRHALALDLDRLQVLPKAGKRQRRQSRQHQRHYHVPSMRQAHPASRRMQGAAYAAAVACGPVGAWLALELGLGLRQAACTPVALLTLLLIAPIAEETVFRLGLHQALLKRCKAQWGALSLANAGVALAFAALHALHQGSAWMWLTIAPALLLGWLWELGAQRLRVPVLFHAWFNLCLILASCR